MLPSTTPTLQGVDTLSLDFLSVVPSEVVTSSPLTSQACPPKSALPTTQAPSHFLPPPSPKSLNAEGIEPPPPPAPPLPQLAPARMKSAAPSAHASRQTVMIVLLC